MQSPTATRARSIALLVCLLAVVLGSLTLRPSAAQAATEPDGVPTMVILDASGSMLEEDAPGPRIDAAKAAVNGLVESLDADAQVGLMVYGTSTGGSKKEKKAGCKDVRTLVPVGPVDAASFTETVDSIQASGYTPIGRALRMAAEELPVEGPRAIVLVSDGIDTCAPPEPCEVAKELDAQGVDLTIHTIGFKVGADARRDLRCIAKATGGTYSDAADSDELADSLQVQVDHAVSGYAASGTPITGTPSQSDEAPLLTPGQYVDTLDHGGDETTGSTKYYRLDVPEGWTAHVSTTMTFPVTAAEDDGAYFAISPALINTVGVCAYAWGQSIWIEHTTHPAIGVLSSDGCDDVQYLRVQRRGNLFQQTTATVEIVVRLEPPADTTGLPDPEKRPVPEAPAFGTATSVEGGLSFNAATELVPGQTYRSTLVEGEERYFRVPVTWGQQFAYSLKATDRDHPEYGFNTIRAQWYNPLREGLAMTKSDFYFPQGSATTITGGSTEPVRYGSKLFGFEGPYYVVISADNGGAKPFEQTFLLTVSVSGDEEAGPVYDLSKAPQDPASQGATGASAAPSDTVDTSATSDTAAGASADGGSTAPADGGTRVAPSVGLGIVLGAGAAGVWLLLRRRRTGPGPSASTH